MSDSFQVFEEFLRGAPAPEVTPSPSSLLRWSVAFRRGAVAERVRALQGLCQMLRPSLSLTTVIMWFGDPWHRTAPRPCPVSGGRREVLAWRHPADERAQIQMLFQEGVYVRGQVVVDGGASLPPRILPLTEFVRSLAIDHEERIAPVRS